MVTTAAYSIGAAVFATYALFLAYREQSLIPVYVVLGSLLTVFLEPIVDVLGNAVHPQIGQYNVLTTNGHPVPWTVLVGYVWYFGALPLIGYKKLLDRSLTQNFIWKVFASVVVTAAIVEQIPLHFGTWVYYGYQPFKFGYMPIWWIFANSTAVLVPFLIIYKMFPKLIGLRGLMVVAIIPTGAFMGHAAAGWPMYNALGTDTESFSRTTIQFASISSIGLAIFILWIMMQLADVKSQKGLEFPETND